MKNRKKIAKIAKLLFKKSVTGGTVDNKKVELILKNLAKKPSDTLKILKIYKKLIETALSWQEVAIETANKSQLDKKLQSQVLSKTKAQKIKYKINPKIIIGAKITHGDWIYDATLDTKIQQLIINN